MMVKGWTQGRFSLLIFIVLTSGFVQGLLLPLQATILEQQGISSSLNGLNTMALYLGVLVVLPFCGGAVRRFGYRGVILIGGAMTLVSVLLFPLFSHLTIWIVLRLLVGAGDSMIHYATQLWVAIASPKEQRGKLISQYGVAFGLGFGLGPLGVNLLVFGEWVPFAVMAVLLMLAILLAVRLDQAFPPQQNKERKYSWKKSMLMVYRLGFVGLIATLIYGFLEASIAGMYPVYGLRAGLSSGMISIVITAFICGSLLLQLPLGILSDRYGRRRILLFIAMIGMVGMALLPWAHTTSAYMVILLFALMGAFVGSLYSLGLVFLADRVPKEQMPEANALASAQFAIGSMMGPLIGGVLLQTIGGGSLFYFLALLFAVFIVMIVIDQLRPIHAEMEYPAA
ncbi:MFS transporter [Mechercharimyces sp. CAU 1602]|uniref:MFS transporter n=1 Tax=Mechercharimyces sp. CAU 1602 TaxID=2973933 RepID=UPI002163E5AE|nr:MFS transporter [Mechercharimyces sp. CAU 1602]MCS1351738.1 MFS transporter [Mechercharimyces sp. CAU 1602]